MCQKCEQDKGGDPPGDFPRLEKNALPFQLVAAWHCFNKALHQYTFEERIGHFLWPGTAYEVLSGEQEETAMINFWVFPAFFGSILRA